MIKRKGDNGSPCRRPQLIRYSRVGLPFTRIDAEVE
nr:hypothetical protein [Tanacetum cinerariifolium]